MLLLFSVNMFATYALHDKHRLMDCPAAGFISYEKKQAGSRAQSYNSTTANGIDDCYRQCVSDSDCGLFEFRDDGVCRMFTTFYLRVNFNLFENSLYTLGFPCKGIENPTKDPSEAPTEAPNDCPAEGYFGYSESFVDTAEPFLSYFLMIGQSVDVDDFCNAACNSHADCEFFEAGTDFNSCNLYRDAFDVSLLNNDADYFVGVPCCPVQGYVIYSGNTVHRPDAPLDMVALGHEEGADNCNAECSLRNGCGYFYVAHNICVMFSGPFHQDVLLSDVDAFVGVPCSS